MKPLSERMRPKSFDDFFGQEHIFNNNSHLRSLLEKNVIPSMIFWGPAGVGKTSIARIISEITNREYFSLSAINSGVKDIKTIIEKTKTNMKFGNENAILFIDEIHRFNKSQQDSLLEAVEKGIITLIGATTENPSFEINSALLSRCQIFVLKHLSYNNLFDIVNNAINNDLVLKAKKIIIEDFDYMYQLSGGDARKILNILEISIDSLSNTNKELTINKEKLQEIFSEKPIYYDKNGEQHYDIISAFIKSIRGSDPNAAVYWLARMLIGGEDIKFIARRMIILASEDIGLANPTALVIANNCFDSIQKIGMPEARIVLSQTVIYLASSPKSNSAYIAINEAFRIVKESGNLEVPLHLRNAPTDLMKNLGYAKDYQYSHNYKNNFIKQEFLPEKIKNTNFYKSQENKREKELVANIKLLWGDKYHL